MCIFVTLCSLTTLPMSMCASNDVIFHKLQIFRYVGLSLPFATDTLRHRPTNSHPNLLLNFLKLSVIFQTYTSHICCSSTHFPSTIMHVNIQAASFSTFLTEVQVLFAVYSSMAGQSPGCVYVWELTCH